MVLVRVFLKETDVRYSQGPSMVRVSMCQAPLPARWRAPALFNVYPIQHLECSICASLFHPILPGTRTVLPALQRAPTVDGFGMLRASRRPTRFTCVSQ